MKSQFVFENIDFERGLNPKSSMKIGLGSKQYIPEMLQDLKYLGFRVTENKVDEWHIRWDISSPIGEGNYYEIAWLGEESLKNGEFGYYLSENRGKHEKFPRKGFYPDPFNIIKIILDLEMKDFDENLREKKTEYSLLKGEIKEMEKFKNKIDSYES